MSYSLTSPVTGSAQTGFTSPTYTHVVDTAPDNNGKQNAVTAVGGTQSGVTVHSVASPFTITMFRPKVLKTLGPAMSNGYFPNVPKNEYRFIVRKGVVPAVNQPAQVMVIDMRVAVPAGSDTYDASNVRAALSAAIGALTQQSAGIGDTVTSGVL